MPALLYVDSSSLLTWALAQEGALGVADAVNSWSSGGGTVVSSRLLVLELQRAVVREGLLDNHNADAIRSVMKVAATLPVTDEVWARAAAIQQHVRTLDAIHLATCELSAATLLTAGLDHMIKAVAEVRGIPAI